MWLPLATTLAHALSVNLLVDVGVEVPLGAKGLTVRAGGGVPVLLADLCGPNGGCRSTRGFPVAGPRGALRWSREERVTVELGAMAGVMHATAYDSGWIMLWQAEARAQVEVGFGAGESVAFAVGGVGSRSLSWRRNVSRNAYTSGPGWEPLALQVGYLARPGPLQRPPSLLVGLGVHFLAFSYA